MSIRLSLSALEAKGDLTRYVPTRTLKRAKRRLFMTRHVVDRLFNPNSPVNLLRARGDIEAALTLWTVGDRVYNDARGRPAFLKRLKAPPPEVWEIRVTNPSPQWRIFGRFAEQDTFVATDVRTRGPLRDGDSRAWVNACNQCVADWASILPMFPPHRGVTVGDYISENFDDFPLN